MSVEPRRAAIEAKHSTNVGSGLVGGRNYYSSPMGFGLREFSRVLLQAGRFSMPRFASQNHLRVLPVAATAAVRVDSHQRFAQLLCARGDGLAFPKTRQE